MKNQNKVKQGKKNRQSGAAFELSVRKDLEDKGWIVAKWMNQVEFKQIEYPIDSACGFTEVKLIPAKHKFCGVGRPMAIGTGFPDFIAFRLGFPYVCNGKETEVIGVECKINGYLDKEEKEKCKWLLENNIFGKILIASKEKEGRKVIIKYKEFENEKTKSI